MVARKGWSCFRCYTIDTTQNQQTIKAITAACVQLLQRPRALHWFIGIRRTEVLKVVNAIFAARKAATEAVLTTWASSDPVAPRTD
jgi:hypothetical protein